MYVYQNCDVTKIDADDWTIYWETEIRRSYAAFDDGHLHGLHNITARWVDNEDYMAGWNAGDFDRIELHGDDVFDVHLDDVYDLDLDMSDWNIDENEDDSEPLDLVLENN